VWETAAAENKEDGRPSWRYRSKSIRFPASREQRWSLTLGRIYPRASRAFFSWTPNDRETTPACKCQGGYLTESPACSRLVRRAPPVRRRTARAASRRRHRPLLAVRERKPKGRIGGGITVFPFTDLAVGRRSSIRISARSNRTRHRSASIPRSRCFMPRTPFLPHRGRHVQNQTGTFYSRTINDRSAGHAEREIRLVFVFRYLTALDRNTPYIVPGEEQWTPTVPWRSRRKGS